MHQGLGGKIRVACLLGIPSLLFRYYENLDTSLIVIIFPSFYFKASPKKNYKFLNVLVYYFIILYNVT